MTDKDLIESLMAYIHIPNVVRARRRIQALLKEADLHQQALAEAEARGYARAVEDAARKVGFLRDQDDDAVWITAVDEATEVIRALAQKDNE